MVLRYACDFGIFLKLFLLLFLVFELNHFLSSNMSSIDNGYLVDANPPKAEDSSF